MKKQEYIATTRETRTSEGRIPHLELYTNCGMIRAPVRVTPHPQCGARLPIPVRTQEGDLIYALPGGGEYRHIHV